MPAASPLRIAAAFAVGFAGASLAIIACGLLMQAIVTGTAAVGFLTFLLCLLAAIPGGLGGGWLVLRFDRAGARRYLVALVGGIGGWLSAFLLTALLVFGLMALLTAIATGEFDAPSMRGVVGEAALFASLVGSTGGFVGGYWLTLRRGPKAMYWLAGGGVLVISIAAVATFR